MSEPREVAKIELGEVHVGTTAAGPVQVVEHRLRVVVFETDGRGKQYLLTIKDNQSGGDIMKSWKDMELVSGVEVWWHMAVGMKPAIFEGPVTLQNHSDLEAARTSCFIDMDNLRYLSQHTFAYNKPNAFRNWVDFVHDNAHCYEVVNGGFGYQTALILAWKFDKLSVAVLAVISTLVTIAVGVVVGVVCHNAGLGVSISAGIVAVLAFAAFVLTELMK